MLALPAYGRQRRQLQLPPLPAQQVQPQRPPAMLPVSGFTPTPQPRPDMPAAAAAPWQPMAMSAAGVVPQPQPSNLNAASPIAGLGKPAWATPQPGDAPDTQYALGFRGGSPAGEIPSTPDKPWHILGTPSGTPITAPAQGATPDQPWHIAGPSQAPAEMLRGAPVGPPAAGGGNGLFWAPSPSPVPGNGGGGGRAAAPSGPIFHNQSYGPPQMHEYKNDGGWWHDPSGMTGQDANRSMGAWSAPGTPGDPGSFIRNNNVAMQRQYLANQAQNSLSSYGAGAPPQPQGAGGGGGNPWMDAYNQARNDNLNRYNELLNAYTQWRQYINDQLSGLGEQQRKDTNETYDNNKGSITQSMIDRGLVGSTVLDSMQTGNERERGKALSRLDESLTRERLAQESPAFLEQAKFMERREDTYPDMNLLAQLMQGVGASGGGGGGVNMGDPFGGALAGGLPNGGFFPGTNYAYYPGGSQLQRGSGGGTGRTPRSNFFGGIARRVGGNPYLFPGLNPDVPSGHIGDSGSAPYAGPPPFGMTFDEAIGGGIAPGGLGSYLGGAAGAIGRGASSASTGLGSLLEMLLGRR